MRNFKLHHRGDIPCDILIVGEGAGKSEAMTGIPFKGPAGNMLNELIGKTIWEYRICITNSVVCVPYTDDTESKFESPPLPCIKACNPRLGEFINLVFERGQKKVVVAMGKPASRAVRLLNDSNIILFETVHPAAILRQDEQMRYDYQNTILTLEEVRDYVHKHRKHR